MSRSARHPKPSTVRAPESLFFGRVASAQVIDLADDQAAGFLLEGAAARNVSGMEVVPPPEKRLKVVPIIPAQIVSQHVVDLKASFRPETKRELNLEQRLELLRHAMRERFGHASDSEHRLFAPRHPDRRPVRAPAGPFLKLPWMMIAAALKSSAERRPAAPAPAVPAPKPAPSEPAKRAAVAPVAALPAPRPLAWHKHLTGFGLAAALIVALPLSILAAYSSLLGDKDAIAAVAGEAVVQFKSAGESAAKLDPEAARAFERAADSLAETRRRLDTLTVRLGALLSGNGEAFSSGTRALGAGESLARAGAAVAAAFDAFEGSSSKTVPERVRALSAALTAALPHLDEAAAQLDGVSARSVPAKYRAAFEAVRGDLKSARSDIERLAGSSSAILKLIGENDKRRYLVVFQNSNELRPTGGFIGSFALMDVKDGKIDKIEIPAGGSYDLRGGLSELVAPPDQLRLVNTRWEFQDSNWFADFPTSARALTWFYERSGGPTVDGVVAINSRLMERLLAVVGPIEMPEYRKTITAENFHLETQKAVELEYDRELNRPKQIISDMAPKLLQKLVEGGSERLLPLAGALSGALAQKDIQVYFRDEEEQAAASGFGWTGELAPPPDSDFLAVVDTNIAGGKTDGVISADIRHEMTIDPNGAIVDTVTLRRTHHGKPGDLFTGIKNIDYVRFYVPRGSELLSAEGFEAPAEGYFRKSDIPLEPSSLLASAEGRVRTHEPSGTRVSEESGLTVFGNWIQLEPGESRAVRVSYRLPFRFSDLIGEPEGGFERVKAALGFRTPTANLKLMVRKQAGAADRSFSTVIRPPAGWSVRSKVPADARGSGDGLAYDAPLDRDLYVGMLIAKER